MKEITNRQLLTAMIIVGAVIALMIIPLYPNGGTALSTRNLGATAFFDNNSSTSNGYYLNTNYPVSAFRTSNTDTIITTETKPQTSYTTYTYSYPQETTNTDYYYPTSNQNLDAYGCAPGANYSVTTGQSCYGYNSYNNYNGNYSYNYNNGGYYSNGVYIDQYGCGTGIIYSVTTGQLCYNRY